MGVKMSLEKKSTQNWEEFYKKMDKTNISPMYFLQTMRLDGFRQVAFEEISKKIEEILAKNEIVCILSAGSGIDFIAYHLKKTFRDKIRITAFDVSSECMAINRELFNDSFEYIVGDIFKHDFSNKKYDIVYNTGLLEHFLDEEKEKIISKISGLLNSPGYYITLNPYVGGKIYTKYMNIAKQNGIWEYGEETPISSLKKFALDNFKLIEEWPCCSISQLCFMYYRYPYLRYLFGPITYLIHMKSLDNIVGKVIGFYGLISIFKKEHDGG